MAAREATHRHEDRSLEQPSSTTAGTTSTSREFPLSGSTGADAPLATSNTDTPDYTRIRGPGEESWSHEHAAHGHEYGGDPCGPEAPSASRFTRGPHAVDTANRLDPHIPGAFDDEESHEITGGAHPTGNDSNYGRDAALAGGAAAVGAGAYGASRDPSDPSTGPAPNTAGPHSSDMLNKADPRVDSDLSKTASSTAGTSGATPSTATTSTAEPTKEHHYGRDAGLATGAGAAGVGAYELEKDHGKRHPVGASSSTDYTNPYSSKTVDPRVGGSARPTETATGSTPAEPATKPTTDHHYGRDAGVAGAGAGAVGLAGYEYEKNKQPSSTTAGPHSSDVANRADPRVDSDRDGSRAVGAGTTPTTTTTTTTTQPQTQHHYGRDAGLAGAGAGAAGVGAYEYEKNKRPDTTAATTGPHDSSFANRADPRVDSNLDGSRTAGTAPTTTTTEPTKDHHYGRDAGLAAGTGVAGVGAYEYANRDKAPAEQVAGTHGDVYSGHRDPGPQQGSIYDQDRQPVVGTTHDEHHKGRDAALAGGAAGAAGVAGYEYSQHDAEQEAKDRLKEQKAHEKELAKEQKAHDKELEKEHKAQEKAAAKEQKHHEKEVAKEEKQHEKDIAAAQKKHDKEVAAAAAAEEEKRKKAQEKHNKEVAAAAAAEEEKRKEAEAKQAKELEKERAHQQKEHDKLVAAEEKKHEKEEKQHQKEVEKEEKQQQKEMEKEEKGEKKHKLFGFLHRKKDEDEHGGMMPSQAAASNMPEREQHHYGRDAAFTDIEGAGATGEHDGLGEKHGRNVLHKDPPANVVREQEARTSTGSHTGTYDNTGNIGTAHSTGAAGAAPASDLNMAHQMEPKEPGDSTIAGSQTGTG